MEGRGEGERGEGGDVEGSLLALCRICGASRSLKNRGTNSALFLRDIFFLSGCNASSRNGEFRVYCTALRS